LLCTVGLLNPNKLLEIPDTDICFPPSSSSNAPIGILVIQVERGATRMIRHIAYQTVRRRPSVKPSGFLDLVTLEDSHLDHFPCPGKPFLFTQAGTAPIVNSCLCGNRYAFAHRCRSFPQALS
jgi:hypothetical protein